MKENKFLKWAIVLVFMTSNALAASIGDDNVDLGKPTSSSNKSVTFKGPTSKKLTSTSAGVLGYNGNTMGVGDGTNATNKVFQFDKGGTNPFFQYNFSTGAVDTGNFSLFNHTGDNLTVGDGTNTNKVLKFNKGASSPEIRYNSTSGKLQFSNDASNFKDIGSGSGGAGGVNYLQDLNGDFETGILNWTNSGGTFVATSTNPIAGDQSGLFTASATAQYVESALITKKLGAGGRTCQAVFEYNWAGVSGELTAAVLDSTNAVIATSTLSPTTSTQSKLSSIANFECDAATQYKVRITSTAASAALKLDSAFIGYGRTDTQLSQASFYGSAKWAGATNCDWSRSNAAFGNFTADADCTFPTVTGKVSSPATKIPAITMTNLEPGTYFVVATGLFYKNNAVATGACYFRMTDGTQSTGPGAVFTASASSIAPEISGTFSYATAQASVDIQIQTAHPSAGACSVFNGNATLGSLEFKVFKYPSSEASAITTETSGFYAAGRISASASDTTLSVSQATFTDASNSDLTLTPAAGSALTQIACADPNPSTGTTCAAGNEVLGFATTVDTAGDYDVCFGFTNVKAITSNANFTQHTSGFAVYQTANASQVPINVSTEGGGTKVAVHRYRQVTSTGGSASQGMSYEICEPFKLATAGKKTFRLQYSGAVNGGSASDVSTNITTNAASAADFPTFSIRKRNQQHPAPIFSTLQNLVKSSGNGFRIEAVRVNPNCTVTPCTMGFNTPGISSVARNSAGNYTVTFTTAFASAPACTIASIFSGGNKVATVANPTTTSLTVLTQSTAFADIDSGFAIMCLGN